MEHKDIVLIEGTGTLEERAWKCRTDTEAANLKRWLRDAGVVSNVISNSEYNSLHRMERITYYE